MITAIGKSHAMKMGIDCEKLSKTDTRISCLSGEEIYPLGTFYANLTGKKKMEGKRKEVTTKEIVYVFEKTPVPYLSRAVLMTLGVIKNKMDIGDHLSAVFRINLPKTSPKAKRHKQSQGSCMSCFTSKLTRKLQLKPCLILILSSSQKPLQPERGALGMLFTHFTPN